MLNPILRNSGVRAKGTSLTEILIMASKGMAADFRGLGRGIRCWASFHLIYSIPSKFNIFKTYQPRGHAYTPGQIWIQNSLHTLSTLRKHLTGCKPNLRVSHHHKTLRKQAPSHGYSVGKASLNPNTFSGSHFFFSAASRGNFLLP